jgi:hypothetical protein
MPSDPTPAADSAEKRRAAIDRAHRLVERAEIELAAAHEAHRFLLANAIAMLGADLAVGDVVSGAKTPSVRGVALHAELGRAAGHVVACRLALSGAQRRLSKARSAWRKKRTEN